MLSALFGRQLTPLLLIAGVTALVLLVYSESYGTMLQLWQQTDHHHGLLVFPIVGYLLWRARVPLSSAHLKPWLPGVLLLAALVGGWLLGRATGVQAIEHLAALLLIPSAVVTFLGPDVVRKALFPLLFVVAAVPIADSLVPVLMGITADISEALLNAVGVPVFREGQLMTLPGGRFEVADVCSGLRYLISGAVVALLFGYLTYGSYLKRIVLVAATGVALVLANGVRAFIVMFVASASEMRYLAGRDHIYFGWLLFGVVIVVLMWIAGRYADPEQVTVNAEEAISPGPSRRSLLPLVLVLGFVMLAATARQFQADLGNAGLIVFLVAAAAALAWTLCRNLGGTPVGGSRPEVTASESYGSLGAVAVVALGGVILIGGPLALRPTSPTDYVEPRTIHMPSISACTGPSGWEPSWRPSFQRPDYSGSATYRCNGASVHAFVAGYSTNLQGRELISDSNVLVPRAWSRYLTGHHHRLTGSNPSKVVEMRAEVPGATALVWYWYRVGERTALSPVAVKYLQALGILSGRSESAVYLLVTPLDSDIDISRQRLLLAAKSVAGSATNAVSSLGVLTGDLDLASSLRRAEEYESDAGWQGIDDELSRP